MRIIFRKPQLTIFAAWFTNLSAGWFLSLFGLNKPSLLLFSLFFCIVTLWLAIQIERVIQTHD